MDLSVRPVFRLQEEVQKIKRQELRGIEVILWKNKLKFVSSTDCELRARLGTATRPINAAGRRREDRKNKTATGTVCRPRGL